MIRTGQNSFVSGEISPSLFGRSDIKARFQGARRICNFVVRKSGGVVKRAGSEAVLDLSAFSGGRVLPFYYSITTGYLLVLCDGRARVIADGAFVQSGGADYTFRVPWTDAQLADISYEQYGDTLHVTHLDVQAQRIIRYADDDWRVSPVVGVMSVVPAQGFKAVSSGFGTAATDVRQRYSLYAVKNGVLSEPARKSVTVETPWTAGGKVTLSWAANMHVHDSYIVAKDMGAYDCILAHYFEEKAVMDSAALSYTASAAHIDAGFLFAADVSAALKANAPNEREFSEVKLHLSKYQMHCKKDAAQEWCLFNFKYSVGSTLESLRVYLGGVCANYDTQKTLNVAYEGDNNEQVMLEGERYADGVWESIAVEVIECAYNGYATLSGDGVTKYRNLRLMMLTRSSDSGIVLRGFKVFSAGADLRAGTWTFDDATKKFSVLGMRGTVKPNSGIGPNTYNAAADANLPADVVGNTGTILACEPVKYVYLDKYPVALDTVSEGEEAAAYVRVTKSGVAAAVELRVFPGAEVKRYPDRANDPAVVFKSNIARAQLLYTYNKVDWYTLPTVYATQSQYSDSPWTLKIPVDDKAQPVVATAQGWAVRFVADDPAQPIVIRAVQLIEKSIEESFVDINHTPNEAVGRQNYIDPGSKETNMAVACVSTYQQRMIYAGSRDYPFTVWFSAAGAPDLLYSTSPMVPSDAFSATIPSARAASIRHVISARRCLVFTEGAVYSVEGSSEGFGFDTIDIKEVSGLGANEAQPVGLSNSVLYVSSNGRELLELQYDITQDGMLPLERIVLAEHLTEGAGIVKMAYQRAPEGVVWCLLSNGRLLSFTCLPEHQVFAWASHSFGGDAVVSDIIGTGAVAEPESGVRAQNDIYAVVRQGDLVRLIKLRANIAAASVAIEKALCMDLMQRVTLELAGDTLAPGLAYPEGDVLRAVDLESGAGFDVAAQDDGTLVCAGELGAGTYALGYPVAAQVDMMAPEPQEGSLLGMKRTVLEACILTRRSASPEIAPYNTGQSYVGAGEPVIKDGALRLEESREYSIVPYGHINAQGWISIKSAGAFPSEILSVMHTLELERDR